MNPGNEQTLSRSDSVLDFVETELDRGWHRQPSRDVAAQAHATFVCLVRECRDQIRVDQVVQLDLLITQRVEPGYRRARLGFRAHHDVERAEPTLRAVHRAREQ